MRGGVLEEYHNLFALAKNHFVIAATIKPFNLNKSKREAVNDIRLNRCV